MNIGEKIREQRLKKKMTQKELGEKLGITQQQVAQYEGGKLNPKLDTLERFANALGVNYTVFLNMQSYKITKKLLIEHPEIKHSLIKLLSEILCCSENYYPEIDKILKSENIDDLIKLANKTIQEIELDQQYNITNIIYIFKTAEDTLIENFKKLNLLGKEEALKRVEELTEIEKYTKPD